MRGNLYAINTVATVNGAMGCESTVNGEVVEFRHLVESRSLAAACIVGTAEESKRCKDVYTEVKKVSAVSGELLVSGDEVVIDETLEGVVGKISPTND